MTKSDDKVPALRFKGFTDEWEQRKLLDILEQPVTDGPHETPNLVKKGIPFISAEAIINNQIDFSKKRGYISVEYNKQCNKKYAPKIYDVYMVKSGSTVGKVAILETSRIFNIWSPLAAMRVNHKNSPYFLYYLLQTDMLQEQTQNKSKGGTQPNLSMRVLEKFSTYYTNVEEEEKIANLLKVVDKLISLQQRKVNNYFQYKTQLINTIFENKNWQMIKLKDVLSVPKKELANVTTKSQIMTVKLNLGGIVDGANRDTLNPSATKYYIRHAGQFIFGKQNFFNGSMAIVPKAMDEKVTSQDVPALNINNEKINSKFLLYYLSRKNFYKHTERFATGTGSKRLHVDTLLNLKIRIPDISYQNQIVSTLTLLDKKLQLETAKLNKLKQLKQFLLQNMFI